MKLCAWQTGGAESTCPAGCCVSVMSLEPLCSLCSQLQGEGTCREGTKGRCFPGPLVQGPCLAAQRRRAGARRSCAGSKGRLVSSCWCACQPGVLLSAVLTSKFTSSPLLFPGSSPTSHLSASGLAARRAAQGEEERAVPARGFSQALFPPFGQGAPCRVCVLAPHPWGMLLPSAVTSVPARARGIGSGRLELAPCPLTASSICVGCSETSVPLLTPWLLL